MTYCQVRVNKPYIKTTLHRPLHLPTPYIWRQLRTLCIRFLWQRFDWNGRGLPALPLPWKRRLCHLTWWRSGLSWMPRRICRYVLKDTVSTCYFVNCSSKWMSLGWKILFSDNYIFLGHRCDLCIDGYYAVSHDSYGQPQCAKCECNENVDPNAIGNCDR